MELREVPLDEIAPCSYLPSRTDGVEDLADAIASRGLRNPIKLAAVPTRWQGRERRYVIVEGERRWLAHLLLKRASIPSEIRTSDPKLAALAAVADRFPELSLFEQADSLHKLKEQFKMDQTDLAAEIGQHRVKVAKLLSVMRLPSSLHIWIKEGRLGAKHIEQLLRLPDSDQAAVGDRAANDRWTVRRLEETVNRRLAGDHEAKAADPDVQLLERELGEKLAAKVSIQAPNMREKKAGTLTIYFYDNETLEGILDRCGLSDG